MTRRFRQGGRVDHETLADDLILMNRDSHAVVVLNATGRLVWDALAEGATLDDLVGLFLAGAPGAPPGEVRRDVAAALDRLFEAGLAVAADDEG